MSDIKIFYIETSIGNVEFTITKERLEDCYIFNGNTKSVSPQNQQMFDKFLNMYEYDQISFIPTNHGYFMNIELDDTHYGSPEYKIHIKNT